MARIATRTVLREIARTLRRPRRLARLIKTEELLTYLRRESIRDYVRESWSGVQTGENLCRRDYACYEDYLAHQRDKLERIAPEKAAHYDRAYRAALRERLESHDRLSPGMTVLCLAARRGTEVQCFHDLGLFAVGLDLNPGSQNPYVLPGDFHRIRFPDGCADVVFTNSLDHAFDLQRVITEIRRVLKPGGLFILEAARGSDEGLTPGYYESFWWSHADDLLVPLRQAGLELLDQQDFSYPWPGRHYCLRAAERVEVTAVSAEPLEVGA